VKTIQKETTKEDLHPERYDESLFRKAYKAGMELRKLNEQEKKKRTIIQVIGSILILTLVFFGIRFVVNNKSSDYTVPIVHDIEENFLVKTPSRIYGFDNIDIEIEALSAMAFDPDSGEVLFEKDIDTQRQIASLTKTMTGIITVENMDLNNVITVSEIPAIKRNLSLELDFLF
jgi:D-alanyl-D-alanine carboxypeptidase